MKWLLGREGYNRPAVCKRWAGRADWLQSGTVVVRKRFAWRAHEATQIPSGVMVFAKADTERQGRGALAAEFRHRAEAWADALHGIALLRGA